MFEQLIANYQTAEQAYKAVNFIPQCGKPGRGFKALRKARREINAAEDTLIIAKIALRNYVQETKLSKERRVRRFESVKAMIPTFTRD